MSALFNTLSCCWLWLLIGILIGWLLNRLLCKCCCKIDKPADVIKATPSTKASAEPAMAPAPTPTVESKPTPKPAVTPVKAATFDLASAKANGFAIKQADDLTVIEGIGPKISELFKSNGLGTFALVAAASADDMRAILDKGGARFRIANPSTWAQQAALAADNKWAELKKLQDALSGGLKK